MINSIFSTHPDLHYVQVNFQLLKFRLHTQGFHDIATVFLLVCGVRRGLCILEAVCTSRLRCVFFHMLALFYVVRAWLSPTLDPIRSILDALPQLLERADKDVGEFLSSVQAPPYYALEWLLTWFAHTYEELPVRVLSTYFSLSRFWPEYLICF